MGQGIRKQQAQAQRALITDAALHLFAQKGFSGASMSDVANHAGVLKGLIYHYFGSKVDLLKAVISRHSFLHHLQSMMTPMPDEKAEIVLLRVAHAWWSVLQRKKEFVFMLFGESQRNPEIASIMGQFVKDGAALMTSYLGSRASKGELRADANFDVITRMFMNGIFLFFIEQSKMCPPLERIPPEIYFEESVKTVIEGLKPGASESDFFIQV